jgi:GH25 family lysozyme M1 (1,4-beta-N-acetylmuramidase)
MPVNGRISAGAPRLRGAVVVAALSVPLIIVPLLAMPPARASEQHAPGIDVSHWQGTIDWQRVGAAGWKFAFAKATEGRFGDDSTYSTNRTGAGAAGMAFGAYHFARPSGLTSQERHADALAEADHFLNTARPAIGDMLPVLDLETSGGLSPSALIRWTSTWLQEVERRLGAKPIIYTSRYFWQRSMGDTTTFASNGYTLWIAHYTSASEPSVPAGEWGGDGWTIWQWSDCGDVPGISTCVDTDRFDGMDLSSGKYYIPPRNTQRPAVSGNTEEGHTLASTLGRWTGDPRPTYAYGWVRCDLQGLRCARIAGATSRTYVLSPGDVGWRIRSKVIATNPGATVSVRSRATAAIRADTTAPTVPEFSSPVLRFRKATRFRVAWSATDDTAVAGYDVRSKTAPSTDGYGPWTTWLAGTASSSATFTGTPGYTYCFSARARDLVGNVSVWSPRRCTAVPLDDRDMAIRSGTWSRGEGSGRYLDTFTASSGEGAALLRRHVEATHISLLVERCPGCGVVRVYWNGVLLRRISLSWDTTVRKRLVTVAHFDSVQVGNLRVKVVSSGRRVEIDGLAVSRAA